MPQGEMSYAFDGTSGFALTPMGAQPLPPEMTAALKDGICSGNRFGSSRVS